MTVQHDRTSPTASLGPDLTTSWFRISSRRPDEGQKKSRMAQRADPVADELAEASFPDQRRAPLPLPQFLDGKMPCSAMHCSKTAPVAVKIGLAVGSANVVCPSPP